MTEAMPFLQKYDITFLRPPTIGRGSSFMNREKLHASRTFPEACSFYKQNYSLGSVSSVLGSSAGASTFSSAGASSCLAFLPPRC